MLFMIDSDKILLEIGLLLCVILWIMAGIAEKYVSTKWRLAYILPAVLCMFFIAFKGFELSFLGAYIGFALIAAGFFKDSRKLRRVVCIIGAVLMLTAIPISSLNKNYRSVSFTKDFKEAFETIEKHYVLTEHKGIDLDALYEEYLPKFRQAEKNNDEIENCMVWLEFCSEFHDGHVNFMPSGDYEEVMSSVYERVLGNDYGLSVMKLSDGSFCAVNVDESLKAMGIFNGTEIISWDGVSPSVLGENEIKYCSFAADIDNEDFWRAAYGSGKGGDSVTVTFTDESGSEKTAVLPKTGESYYTRLKKTVETIDQGIEAGHLTWTDINETTAALRIKMMMADYKSAESGDHSMLKGALREKAEELKANGVDTLIFDMRGNSGGSGDMVKAIAEVFAPGGVHYYCTDALWDSENECYATDENGRFVKGTDVYYAGEDVWSHGRIIILVNSASVSAADHLAYIMRQFDNVTVAGFTESNGSAQGVGRVSLSCGGLSISGSLLLDENGDVLIDGGTDRQSGNKLELTVPFDKQAIKSLFDDGEDYIIKTLTDME